MAAYASKVRTADPEEQDVASGLNNVPGLDKQECKELVVDGPQIGEQVCTVRNRTNNRERRGENGGGSAGAELNTIARIIDL